MTVFAIDERAKLMSEARSWIGTPYVHGACIKRVGVDCARFIGGVFVSAGLEPPIDYPNYSPDWYMHESRELLLDIIMQRAMEISEAECMMSDVVVYRFGRCYSHAAIICAWPHVIHAFKQTKRVSENPQGDSGLFADRPRRFFRRKAWS